MTPEGRRIISSEAALATALVTIALSNILLTKSDSGLATLTLFVYVCYVAVPSLSFGLWNNIIQCCVMLALILAMRRIKPGYIISFGIAMMLGVFMDLFDFLLAGFPTALAFRIIYWVIGFLLMAFAVYLLNACMIPVLPFDTLTRDIPVKYNISFRTLRTSLDVFILAASAVLGLLSVGRLAGIGAGSVLMLFTGAASSLLGKLIDRYFVFEPRVEFLGRLSR